VQTPYQAPNTTRLIMFWIGCRSADVYVFLPLKQ
jgi:hypothetical protein